MRQVVVLAAVCLAMINPVRAIIIEEGFRCTKFLSKPNATITADGALAACDAEPRCVAISRSVLQEERPLTRVELHFRGKCKCLLR